MQWIQCSMAQLVLIDALNYMRNDWMHWIPCSVVKCIPSECSGLHAAWGNVSRLDAVESMQHAAMDTRLHAVESMQHCVIDNNLRPWIPCIKIQCSGFHAALWNGSRVNAVDSMQCGPMDPDWMEWIPCSVIECSGFYAEWCNVSRLLKCIRCRLM